MTDRIDIDDERLERIDNAFAYVPLIMYDEVTKLAERALGEFIEERDKLRDALIKACYDSDYCYVCENHPSSGHAPDCLVPDVA
jgi:hypothetical protein